MSLPEWIFRIRSHWHKCREKVPTGLHARYVQAIRKVRYKSQVQEENVVHFIHFAARRGATVIHRFYMQARSSTNIASYNNFKNPLQRSNPNPLQLLLNPRSFLPRSASPSTPSSPSGNSSSTYSSRESNERRASHHKSLCELIPEELNLGSDSDLSATPSLHNLDLTSELYKRHHKPRSPLIRSQTEPYYLSTTTTKPVHIPSSKFVHFSWSIPSV